MFLLQSHIMSDAIWDQRNDKPTTDALGIVEKC